MTHEKIFQRRDGTAVKISVWLYVQENKSNWGYVLRIREPESEQWIDPFNDREYLQRSLDKNPQNGAITTPHGFAQYISQKEIMQAKMELWRRIKPV
jgi:hypothetical protein